MAKTIVFLALLFLFSTAYAVPYTVGNDNGWSINVDYAAWARSSNFVVGDTLVFNYGPRHSVAEVSASDYMSCNTANPKNLYAAGPTTIALNATGDRYFICAAPGHCNLSQKLTIYVTAPPQNGSSIPSTAADTLPISTASPPPSSAAATLGGSQIVLPLVLAAMARVIVS